MLIESLRSKREIYVIQRRELAELIGFETRNKYSIETSDGTAVGYAAEQQKGMLGFFLRQLLGHWRSFHIFIFDKNRNQLLRAVHPFRFFFKRLEVYDADGNPLGSLQQRFALLTKKFDMETPDGQVLMSVASPIWRIWTFVFERQGRNVASIEKKWAGLLTETFTDTDRFRITFNEASLTLTERQLLLAAAIFIDLLYFEKKASQD